MLFPWNIRNGNGMNKGIAENIPALDYPADRIKRLYDINVHGSYFCAREAAKRMIDTGTKGSITLVASMSGKIVNVPQPQAPYNASKAGPYIIPIFLFLSPVFARPPVGRKQYIETCTLIYFLFVICSCETYGGIPCGGMGTTRNTCE